VIENPVVAQLPLNLQLRDDATLESFYPGHNGQVVHAIQAHCAGKGDPFLYCWGAVGVGKSHLLQAACHTALCLNIPTVYVPLQVSLSSTLLQDLEKVPLVCLDDIEQVAGNAIWEEALFHFLNKMRAQQNRLIVSARNAPKYSAIQLPDLKSRLAWGVTYQIHALEDEEKLNALILRAGCRGLELNRSVAQFLLSRCTRSLFELFQTLELLDRASLAEQRRLTIPFVKQVLGI